MTRDQEIVIQLQRRLPGWDPDGRCKQANHSNSKSCEYDKQGRLIELHFCNLKLVQIPPEVWQFSALQRFFLFSNQLSTLPAEIGNLSSLQELYLGGCQLSALPAEIGKLSSLRGLVLVNCQLSTLPVEIGSLSSLQRLVLQISPLSTLPAEIGKLSSLRELDLLGNQLSTLPAEIGKLSSLQKLVLLGNQLSTLPAEMGNLSALRYLDLDGNPLRTPPPEIIAQGIPAILAYLRTLRPIKIFYCYAHEDKDLRDRIDSHLGVLKRLGHIVGWYDREIQAGMEWEREIETHLSTASIILLLVSADFVNSDYCYGVEMQKALEMHEKGKARVLPILLRPVDWQGAPFAKLQMLPTGAKPITKWPDQDEALEDVAKQIRAVVTILHTRQS